MLDALAPPTPERQLITSHKKTLSTFIVKCFHPHFTYLRCGCRGFKMQSHKQAHFGHPILSVLDVATRKNE